MKKTIVKFALLTIFTNFAHSVCLEKYQVMLKDFTTKSPNYIYDEENQQVIYPQAGSAMEDVLLGGFAGGAIFGNPGAVIAVATILAKRTGENLYVSKLDDMVDMLKNSLEQGDDISLRRPLSRFLDLLNIMGVKKSEEEIVNKLIDLSENGSLCDGSIFTKVKRINRAGKVKRKIVEKELVPSKLQLARYFKEVL